MHVNDLLKIAVDNGASDLHLKVGSFPMMRVRGVLQPATEEKKLDHEDVVAMSAAVMSTAQRQKFKESQEVDLAYSVPGLGRFRCNIFQQRGTVGLVLRVIPMQIRSAAELGLPPVLTTIAEEERGLVLVTGTTGSGKSTTLAALIDHINQTRAAHVMTVEDPIEFLHRDSKSMVNQREVSVDTRSFAQALRSALRQDPDVILVGEMRDFETIETGLLAAETGHLVFSTLHTNDAPTTRTRLMNMGIAPFNIATSVMLITAQRLARRLCSNCKRPVDIPKPALLRAGFSERELDGSWQPYTYGGCETCKNTGYKGRVGIYQVMPISEEINRIIMQNGNAIEIAKQARREGVKDLRQSGLLKVKQGVTSLEEVEAVTNE
jgi:pilus retraction protein PilT